MKETLVSPDPPIIRSGPIKFDASPTSSSFHSRMSTRSDLNWSRSLKRTEFVSLLAEKVLDDATAIIAPPIPITSASEAKFTAKRTSEGVRFLIAGARKSP
jgi:hypothetical protein